MTSAAAGVLASPLLAHVPHAFSTRRGGVSGGAFSSLNFGNPGELPPGVERDRIAHIAENFRRLLNEIHAGAREIVQVHQVHGCAVHVVRAGEPTHAQRDAAGAWVSTKADAIVTDDPARVLAVRVADCTPVLIASTDGRVVAAVHAGWRGVISGVALAAAEQMRRVGARGLVAAIGPCIGPERFEVGPEVVREFAAAFSDPRVIREHPDRSARAAGKAMIDLKLALKIQLEAAGAEQIDTLPHCTVAEPELFFSHRRDAGVTGRMVGVIGPIA